MDEIEQESESLLVSVCDCECYLEIGVTNIDCNSFAAFVHEPNLLKDRNNNNENLAKCIADIGPAYFVFFYNNIHYINYANLNMSMTRRH